MVSPFLLLFFSWKFCSWTPLTPPLAKPQFFWLIYFHFFLNWLLYLLLNAINWSRWANFKAILIAVDMSESLQTNKKHVLGVLKWFSKLSENILWPPPPRPGLAKDHTFPIWITACLTSSKLSNWSFTLSLWTCLNISKRPLLIYGASQFTMNMEQALCVRMKTSFWYWGGNHQ